MEALYLLVPLSLLIVAAAVWIFFRMADSGQFDDPVGPAHQILLDDDRPAPSASSAARPPASKAGQASAADQPSAAATAAKSADGGA